MSRNKFILFILVLILIILGLGWYFLFRTTPSTDTSGTTPDSDLFPFGGTTGGTSGGTTGTTPGSSTIDLSNGSTGSPLPRLRKISNDKVSGSVIVGKGDAAWIRYMDRATGHVFELNAAEIAQKKVSNTTLPQIQETLWSADGKKFVARYLKDSTTIQSFYGIVSTSTPDGGVEGYFLSSNIRDIATFSDRSIYLDPSTAGNVIVSNIDGTKKALIASFYSRDWSLSWTSPISALVSSKPSGLIPGYVYTLDVSTGKSKKIVGDVFGLSALMNSNGTYVLASAGGKAITSAMYSVTDDKLQLVPLNTISDKCAWSKKSPTIVYCAVPQSTPGGTYPDDWYQGLVSFSDKIWKIDAESLETDFIMDPIFEGADDMDMMRLDIDTNDEHLIFTNKKDLSLWELDL